MAKLQMLLQDKIVDKNVLKYLPGIPPLAYQGII